MVNVAIVPIIRSTRRIFLPLVVVLTLLHPLVGRAQNPSTPDPGERPDNSEPTDPNNVRPVSTENLILSIPGGQRLMGEAANAIGDQNYKLAAQKLQEARQVFNQLANFYQQLSATFSAVDPRLADTNRTKALETAQFRDEATYQLALVHRAENKPELAIPLLIQILRSQQPTRELGKKAYQQLLEIGFVDIPYPRPIRDSQPQPTPTLPNPENTPTPKTPESGEK